jgi:hypothetical protein
MKKIFDYSQESSVMRVSITFEGKEYKFHIGKELNIPEKSINSEIKIHPASYGFISMLHKRMIGKHRELERERKLRYSNRLQFFLSSKESKFYRKNSKFPTKDLALSLVETDKEYIRIQAQILEIENSISLLEVCVRSMEVRANLLQTLASNLRKEKF